MTRSDKLIYSFLFLSLIVIIFIFYKSFNKNEDTIEILNEKKIVANKEDLEISSKKENIIENIEYYSIDNYGNKFEVKATDGITSK